ncbi:MAG: hypothetical protein J3K34DRAFT_425282 [Monoraphidium minutum]|nr:MAG: hypothetical protein J3K34DRAFT_425282 [Monoraphidium minutum]
MEKENDRGIEALSERIGLLKQATHGIRSEVDTQHSVLDRMADSMLGTQGVLGNAATKFKTVMADKDNRRMLSIVSAMVVALLFVYYIMFKR